MNSFRKQAAEHLESISWNYNKAVDALREIKVADHIRDRYHAKFIAETGLITQPNFDFSVSANKLFNQMNDDEKIERETRSLNAEGTHYSYTYFNTDEPSKKLIVEAYRGEIVYLQFDNKSM